MKSDKERLAELDELYKKARAIAADFIGCPVDEEDEKMIAEATPMQAIESLEQRLKELTNQLNERDLKDVAPSSVSKAL